MENLTLSKVTLQVIKNVSIVNPTMKFFSGNYIYNCSPGFDVICKAKIKENFPRDFCIDQVPTLLSLIDSFNEPFLDFYDNYLRISNNKSCVKYWYCDPEVVKVPSDINEKDISIKEPIAEFNISSEEIKRIFLMKSALSLDYFKIYSENGDVYLTLVDQEGITKDSYQYDTHTKSNEDFSFYVNLSMVSLNLISSDYSCKVSENGLIEFYSEEFDLNYWVGGLTE